MLAPLPSTGRTTGSCIRNRRECKPSTSLGPSTPARSASTTRETSWESTWTVVDTPTGSWERSDKGTSTEENDKQSGPLTRCHAQTALTRIDRSRTAVGELPRLYARRDATPRRHDRPHAHVGNDPCTTQLQASPTAKDPCDEPDCPGIL